MSISEAVGGYSHIHSFTRYLWLLLHDMAELSRCDKGQMAFKARDTYSLCL